MKRRKMMHRQKAETEKNAGFMPPGKHSEKRKSKAREKRLEGKAM